MKVKIKKGVDEGGEKIVTPRLEGRQRGGKADGRGRFSALQRRGRIMPTIFL